MTIFLVISYPPFLLSFHVLLLNISGHLIIVTSTVPFMLSWVMGSRRILRPRFLLAAFVFHFLPSWDREIIKVGMSKQNFLYLSWRICLKVAVRCFSERRMIILFFIVSGKKTLVFVVLVTSCVPTSKAWFADLVKHGLASFWISIIWWTGITLRSCCCDSWIWKQLRFN